MQLQDASEIRSGQLVMGLSVVLHVESGRCAADAVRESMMRGCYRLQQMSHSVAVAPSPTESFFNDFSLNLQVSVSTQCWADHVRSLTYRYRP